MRAVCPQLLLLPPGLINAATQFIRRVDHAREFARYDCVLEEDARVVKVVINSNRAFKQVIVQRVVQSDPVRERLCGAILESPQVEADRTITFLFRADAAHHNLKVLRGLPVVWSKRETGERDFGPLL